MERGAELESIDLNKGLSVAALEELIGERDYKQFLNSRNALYREMKMKENPPPRGEALRLMSANPNLIKRPVAVAGRKLVLGFDSEALERLTRPVQKL